MENGTKVTISTKNWDDKQSDRSMIERFEGIKEREDVYFIDDDKENFASSPREEVIIPVKVTGYYKGRIFCEVVEMPEWAQSNV